LKDFWWKMMFWFGLWLAVFFGGLYLKDAQIPRWLVPWIRGFGLLLVAVGVLLNAVAGRTLKKFGHAELNRRGFRAPDRLVTTGIYSCMRHPAQFGSGLVAVGAGMLSGTLEGILLSGWGFALSLLFMLNIEEPETARRFPDYCEKMMDKPAVSISPSCIIKGIRRLRQRD